MRFVIFCLSILLLAGCTPQFQAAAVGANNYAVAQETQAGKNAVVVLSEGFCALSLNVVVNDIAVNPGHAVVYQTLCGPGIGSVTSGATTPVATVSTPATVSTTPLTNPFVIGLLGQLGGITNSPGVTVTPGLGPGGSGAAP